MLNGIAYDPATKHFLITGKNWPAMFEVTFAEAQQSARPILPLGILKLFDRTIRLALPAITENVFTSVCFLADALMVAALKDEAALAAVGISGVVLWRLRSMAACLQVSVGATVARRWGEGNVTAARTVFTHGTFIGFLIGCLVLPLLPLTRAIFGAMHAEPSVLAYVIPYFQPILLVFPFRIASVSMTAAIRAAGDTRTPMISSRS